MHIKQTLAFTRELFWLCKVFFCEKSRKRRFLQVKKENDKQSARCRKTELRKLRTKRKKICSNNAKKIAQGTEIAEKNLRVWRAHKKYGRKFWFFDGKPPKKQHVFLEKQQENAITSIQCAGGRMAYYLLYIKIKLLLNKFCFEKEIK